MKVFLKKITVILFLGVVFIRINSVTNLDFNIVQPNNIGTGIDPGPANFK